MEDLSALSGRSSTCVNCAAEVTGRFCPMCGQRAQVKRITLREGWNDFWSRVYGFDGMFPRTLRDFTIRPGIAARDYIAGNRVKYYGPVGYMFLMVTLMYLVASLLGIDLIYFLKWASSATGPSEVKPGSGLDQFTERIMSFLSDNMKLISFLFIPIQAFCSRYIFFRKAELNFLEHAILPLYVQGHVYWITVLNLLYYKAFGDFFPLIVQWLSFLYVGYAYVNFFPRHSTVKAFLKGIAINFLSMILFVIVVIVVLLMVFGLNPDALEMIRPSNN